MHGPCRRRSCDGQLPHRLNNPKPHTPPIHIAGGKQLVRALGGFYLSLHWAALFYEEVGSAVDVDVGGH